MSNKSNMFKEESVIHKYNERINNSYKPINKSYLPKKSRTFVFVLGNNLINSNENDDFTFPLEHPLIFKDKYKNDEILLNRNSLELVKRKVNNSNSNSNSPIVNQFQKHSKNIVRYSAPDDILIKIKKSSEKSNPK